jgi:heme exporter protein A
VRPAHPAAGEIRWKGEPIGKLGEDYRRELCYLGHHNAIKEELTPLENLLASARLADETLDEAKRSMRWRPSGWPDARNSPAATSRRGRSGVSRWRDWSMSGARCGCSTSPSWRWMSAAVELVAGLIGAHLQRGGLAVLTTHQPVDRRRPARDW